MKVLFRLYGHQIFSLALSYLGNKEDAEDCVQEIFLRIYKNLPSYKLGHRVFPWIYTISVNTLKNYLRKLKRISPKRNISLGNLLVGPSSEDADLLLKEEEKPW
ncbi:MAG: sigma-70 family RNA polymerase sigma factor [Spirochaetaceae bacterium]|jgi:RNA polymerase sigma-70 factor (ECF subfamily)|nr:sigma-70 family RNA polymerase sigma factor [Spirochaetaceae bacterium]